ncbi:MAG: hypothetical protein ACE5KP_03580 [Dehalococcoidales bacterium]
MDIFYAVAPRVIVILGLVNLIAGLLIFVSCRCLPGSKIGSKLMQYQPYKSFFKYHCHIWKVFWPSVMVHATLALIVFV